MIDKVAAPGAALAQMRPLLIKLAQMRLRNDAYAEDAVSETVIAALERSDTFEARSTFRTWVVGILKHKIIDIERQLRREVTVLQPSTTDDFDDHEHECDAAFTLRSSELSEPEFEASERQFLHKMQSLIDRLPPTAAQAFVMRACLDYSTEEICAALSISPTNCNVIMFRTRVRLRESVAATTA